MITNLIIAILWVCCIWSCLAASWETMYEGDLTNFEIVIVLLVIFAGAPIFVLAGMLESIIEIFTGGSDDGGPVP